MPQWSLSAHCVGAPPVALGAACAQEQGGEEVSPREAEAGKAEIIKIAA